MEQSHILHGSCHGQTWCALSGAGRQIIADLIRQNTTKLKTNIKMTIYETAKLDGYPLAVGKAQDLSEGLTTGRAISFRDLQLTQV